MISAVNWVICFYIIQRLFELYLSRNNEAFLIENSFAEKLAKSDALQMRGLHICWFISPVFEANSKGPLLDMRWGQFIVCILLFAQAIRVHSMKKLQHFWTVTILRLKTCVVYDKGLYKFLRHPNYFAVILELIFVPLLLKSYFTLVIFSVLNIFVLKNRIELEEGELMKCSNYKEIFKDTKIIIPFLY